MHIVFPPLHTYAIPFDSLNEGNPLKLLGSYLVRETRMAVLQSDKGRTMVDSVVCTQHINVTDTQTATSP